MPLTARDIELVKKSGLIDSKWYLQKYPDVAAAGMDPVEHYLRHGLEDGREPGPAFDAWWYLQKYEQARNSGLNPVLHYVKIGKEKGYLPQPGLDSTIWWANVLPEPEGSGPDDEHMPLTPGWLKNLQLAAYSQDTVGTATPFSNNAGAFPAPPAR